VDLDDPKSTGDIPVPPPGTSLILENGVTVSFDLNPATGFTGAFEVDDYWAFAARATDGTVESLVEAPPLGIHHHYARLALVTPLGTPSDCRIPWPPPSSGESCGCSCGCSVVVSAEDLTGDITLQSTIDQFVVPAMVITAADQGFDGNNIAVTIAKIVAGANPSQTTFDVTVTETDRYFGLTLATIKETLAAQPGLVPVAEVHTQLGPPNPGTATLSLGTSSAKARLLLEDVKGEPVIELVAKKAGTDGNLTSVTIANVDASAGTFDLIATWTKTLSAVTLATIASQFADPTVGLSYEVTVAPSSGGLYSVPGPGKTYLDRGSATNIYALTNAEVCLMPGMYALAEPLSIEQRHSGLTLRACQPEVVLMADPAHQNEFLQGLITLESAESITLSGLRFQLPVVQLSKVKGGRLFGLSADLLPEFELNPAQMEMAVGVRPSGCSNLRIENCTFDFQQEEGLLFEAGILASEANYGLIVSNNCFQHKTSGGGSQSGEIQLPFGFLLAPNVAITQLAFDHYVNGTVTPALLQDAAFTGNTFDGLAAPVVIFAECGAVALEENIVTNCYSGAWLIARRMLSGSSDQEQQLAFVDGRQDPVLETALAFGQGYSLPVNSSLADTIVVSEVDVTLKKSPFQNHFFASLDRVLQVQVALNMAATPHIYAKELDLSFDGLNNKINAAASDGTSGGPGLFIWGEDEDYNTTVIVSSNKIENNSDPYVPTIAIAQVAFCTMTGNVVMNDSGASAAVSLYLSVLWGMAVTGNIFYGNTNLPAPWTGMNTIIIA